VWWFGGGWWWWVRVGWRLVCVGVGGWFVWVWFCCIVLGCGLKIYIVSTVGAWWWWLLYVICRWGLDVGLGGFVWVDAFQHIVRHPVQHLFNYVDYTWYVNLLIIKQLPIYSILFDILIGLTLNKQLFFIKISRGYYLK